MLKQVAEIFMRDLAGGAVEDQEAGRIASFRRNLRDEFRRQLEVEVSRPHGALP
jgi:hypothetical protein